MNFSIKKAVLTNILLIAILSALLPESSFAQHSTTTVKQAQPMVAAIVDLAAVITFHPIMRDFDYRSGKFVSRVDVSKTPSGLEAWKQSQNEQRRIKALESAIELQTQRVNEELAKNRAVMQEGKKAGRPEFEKLTRMSKEHKELLSSLASRVLGGFPETLLGNMPKPTLERVMSEVLWAIQTSAQAYGAAIVINTSTGDLKSFTKDTLPPSPPQPKSDVLEKWNIRSLADLEALVNASGTLTMPFAGPKPQKRPGLVCGGHFESVTDPEMLKSLVTEFYDNRQAFVTPFLGLGATRHILSGSIDITQIDLTPDAVNRLLSLYKTRPAERDAIMNLLRERLVK